VNQIEVNRVDGLADIKDKFIHRKSCEDLLNQCWRVLQEIKKEELKPLSGFAFRFALILYVNPFTSVNGSRVIKTSSTGRKTYKKYRLGLPLYLPVKFLELHETIAKDRNMIHAHMDLNSLDVKSVTTCEIAGEKTAFYAQNVIHGVELIDRIDEIIELIGLVLDDLRPNIETLTAALPREFAKP
jgi:hypothetical protein